VLKTGEGLGRASISYSKRGNWTAILDRKRLKINGKDESERDRLLKCEHGESIAFAIGKRDRNRAKRVWEKRPIPKESEIETETILEFEGVNHMTLAQIEDEIRSLRSSERIELYKWLDHNVVADCGVETSFRSRLGVDRALEIRHALDQKINIADRSILLTKSSHLLTYPQQAEH
jgi:hypothetical protein